MKKKKLVIIVNYLSFFLSHRLAVAKASKAKGYEVIVAYGELRGADPKILEKMGLKVNNIPMQPGGINFFQDLKTLYYMWNFLREIKPDIVHLVTIKPYLYGGIISRLLGVPALVSAISGLGSLFINIGLLNRFLRLLLYPIYKFALNHVNQKIIFQNKDDLAILKNWGVLQPSKAKLIKGSGIQIKNFTKLDEPEGKITICFAARLLRDKGLNEFLYAAREIKIRGLNARFFLAGEFDENNPSGLSLNEINKFIQNGYVEFLGYQKDIPSLYSKSHIICLPSYREGLPKSLIEAAAASRAIVTTDVPGCRDAIIPNVTGLLVPAKDPEKLVNALQILIENPEIRISMGKAGRKLAEREFLIEKIVQKHLDIYQELLTDK